MKRNIVTIILFSILTVLLLIYFFSAKETRKQYSWKESYKSDSDQPYGTQFIRQLLEDYRPGEKFIFNDKAPLSEWLAKDTAAYPADYIFIGNQLYLPEEDRDALLAFIHAGNDAFIATRYLPLQLVDSIFLSECEQGMFVSEYTLPAATLNFYHTALQTSKGYTYTYREGSGKKNYTWSAVQPGIFCDSARAIVALGHFDDHAVNFVRFPFGDGNLYVHTNPIVFSNYFMRMPDKVEYAASVLSHLGGKTIIWDEYSRGQLTEEEPQEKETNPLAYILQHQSLKYAWWMMLASAILYTVFTAKRKQRIIPVREEKVNTSLEYIKMISALHFENGNNRDIAVKKMKHFLYFIRARYGIHAQKFTQEHFKRLAVKSQIPKKEIEFIFEEYARIESNPYGSSGAHQLMTLYNAIDHFYKHCK